MKNDDKLINLVKLNQNQQTKFLKVFAKIDNPKKFEILQSQKKLFHKLKNDYRDTENPVLTLASLILAIKREVESDDETSLNISKLRARKKRLEIKKEKLLGYWAIVRTLKFDEEMSFRGISKYLETYYRFEVSYSYIYQMWNELENESEDI